VQHRRRRASEIQEQAALLGRRRLAVADDARLGAALGKVEQPYLSVIARAAAWISSSQRSSTMRSPPRARPATVESMATYPRSRPPCVTRWNERSEPTGATEGMSG
jgi:hypothetical protein